MFSSGAILFLMVGSISMIGHFSGAQFVSITDVHFRQPCHRFSDCGITLDQYCHPVLRRCECTPPYEFSYEMNRCSLSPCIRSCKAIGLECVRGDCVLCKVNGKDNCNNLKSNGSHFAYPFWTIVVLCGCIALFLLIVMCFCQSRCFKFDVATLQFAERMRRLARREPENGAPQNVVALMQANQSSGAQGTTNTVLQKNGNAMAIDMPPSYSEAVVLKAANSGPKQSDV